MGERKARGLNWLDLLHENAKGGKQLTRMYVCEWRWVTRALLRLRNALR